MRLSDHCLPIEKLRKSNVPEERRFCTLCHPNRIGNEEHIFNCTNPDVVSLRNAFLSTSISLVKQLDHLSPRVLNGHIFKAYLISTVHS